MSLVQIELPPASLRTGTRRAVAVVALVGQPNCGKSTLFNSVAGYRAETSNFPGTTVQVSKGRVRLNGHVIELVDLPGIYSLTAGNPAERSARRFLLQADLDLIIHVLDASLLSRSLELTAELLEMGLPTIVCLNMADEAERKGIAIDSEQLSELLGVPVLTTVATAGVGVRELFDRVRSQMSSLPRKSAALAWSRDAQQQLERLEECLRPAAIPFQLSSRFVAAKLLEEDGEVSALVPESSRQAAAEARAELESRRGRPAPAVVMSERHDVAMRLFERVARVGRQRPDIRRSLDRVLTHPLLGYVALLAVFVALFWGVFGLGSSLETWLQGRLDLLYLRLVPQLAAGTLAEAMVRSLWAGFLGGAAIVLPYLVPFLFGLALLEDSGYLPRMAYLLDGLLHRIGLHGTSVLPIMLGYGCSVPACMATRILNSRRDRFLASVVAVLVPCSARSNVIFALVAFFIGPAWALGLFLLNGVLAVFSGWMFSRVWPEVSPGLVLEVPGYQWPRPQAMARKVWIRLREFLLLSWPLLIVGSAVLGLAEYLELTRYVNLALAPVTMLLGLPLAVGVPLIFGILRKELTLVMLVQALGTAHVNEVLTTAQILVLALFITFYMPCLPTIAVMTRELGKKLTGLALAYTFALALAVGLMARLGFALF